MENSDPSLDELKIQLSARIDKAGDLCSEPTRTTISLRKARYDDDVQLKVPGIKNPIYVNVVLLSDAINIVSKLK